MKSLERYAKENNLLVIPITYRFNGIRIKRKGFDLCKQDHSILVSFEPVSFVHRNIKWFASCKFEGAKHLANHLTCVTYKWLCENINPVANSGFKCVK